MSNPTILGDTTITWGTSGLYSLGYVQRVRDLSTGEEAEIDDDNGQAVALILFNARDELEVDMIVKSGDTLPTRGAAITIAGKAGICLEVENVWESKAAEKCSIKAKRYAFNT